MFNKLLSRRVVEYGAVIFDAGGPTYRHEEYADYKATRPQASDELREQIPWIHKVVEAYGFPQLRLRGHEADDLIGTLTRMGQQAGMEVWIVSSDKDFAQLVRDDVKMWDNLKDVVYDRELVRKKWGVVPEQFVDFLALVGDKSDNIPGVPGIGAKGAMALLDKHGSLAAALQAEPATKTEQLLHQFRHNAELSERLARIQQDVPLDPAVDIASLKLPGADREALNALFTELEFYSLLQAGAKGDVAAGEARAAGEVEIVDWDGEPPPDYLPVAVQLIWTGLTHRAQVQGLALSWEPLRSVWVTPERIPELAAWLADPQAPKRVHDLRCHLVVLWSLGLELHGAHDTRLMSYLCEPTKVIPHDLAGVVKEVLQRTLSSSTPREDGGQRAHFVGLLWEPLLDRLNTLGLAETYRELDLPLSRTLARMQHHGVLMDRAELAALGTEFALRLAQLEGEVHVMAGRAFNLGSTKQLSDVLFEELKLPVVKKTKTGYSTDSEVLEKLALKHPIAATLLEHRKVAKLINTYTDVLGHAIWDKDERIHASLQQTVSATGRLISTDPDLQRTPIRTPEGIRIRRCFVAPPGHRLISADWSQIELRVLAHVSGDPALLDAFAGDHDIHRRTAAGIFECSEAEVTPKQREAAKTVNFATIYGQGPTALAQNLGVSRTVAADYIEGYFRTYAGVREWLDATIAEAVRKGSVTTLLGRRRWIPELSSRNRMERQAGERQAANTPIQGSAADLCKLAMLLIDREIQERGLATHMLMQIHDELVFEAPDEEVDSSCELITRHMTGCYPLKVPLKVAVGTGHTWAEAH